MINYEIYTRGECGACEMMKDITKDIAHIVWINYDEHHNPEVKSFPFIIKYHNGEVVGKRTGFHSPEMLEAI